MNHVEQHVVLMPHVLDFFHQVEQECPWLVPFFWRLYNTDTTGLFVGPGAIPLRYTRHSSRRRHPLPTWDGSIVLDTRDYGKRTLGYYACGICGVGWRRGIISHVNDHIRSTNHQAKIRSLPLARTPTLMQAPGTIPNDAHLPPVPSHVLCRPARPTHKRRRRDSDDEDTPSESSFEDSAEEERNFTRQDEGEEFSDELSPTSSRQESDELELVH